MIDAIIDFDISATTKFCTCRLWDLQ